MLRISAPPQMPPHSFLYGILVSLTSSVNYITTYAPTPNGFLKRKLRYTFIFRDFEELRRENMCIPDGLIINEDKRLLIIPECKSGIAKEKDAEPRIEHQITIYSSKQFHKILSTLINYDEYEIVVFTFPELIKAMIQQLQVLKLNDVNIVMWSLEEGRLEDQVSIRKVYGKHIDTELNQAMSLGVSCEPPAREFIDPDMPEPRITFVLGMRLLNTYGECLFKKNMVVTPSEFRKGNLDLVLSPSKLRHFFRVLGKLIPDLCRYDRKSGNVVLKKRLDFERISLRLSQIGSMTNEEYRKALGLPVKEELYRKVEEEIVEVLKTTRIPKLEEIMWGEKS